MDDFIKTYLLLTEGTIPKKTHSPSAILSEATTVTTALMAKPILDFTISILATKHELSLTRFTSVDLSCANFRVEGDNKQK